MTENNETEDQALFQNLRVVELATMVFAPSAAVILADFDGYGDTNIHIAQNGMLTPIGGLPNSVCSIVTCITN